MIVDLHVAGETAYLVVDGVMVTIEPTKNVIVISAGDGRYCMAGGLRPERVLTIEISPRLNDE